MEAARWDPAGTVGSPLHYTCREAQASGMVSVQASCSTSEAFVLMQDRANDDGVTLAAIAVEVVERRLRFGD